MRIPDWLVYAIVLAVIVTVLFSQGPEREPSEIAPPRLSAERREPSGPLLPEADPFDERVLVQVGEPEDGVGTAFAINRSGVWLTARHVVDGCEDVGLSVGNGRIVPVEDVRTSLTSDLALLRTDRAPHAVTLDMESPLRVGQVGYHVGFPQGNAGEASSQLLARSRLVTRGRYELDEPVLAWVETGRSDGLEGTLSGMSGGPVFDDAGSVVGVTVAESPRRGRIYTATPDAISRFLDEQGVGAPALEARPLAASNLEGEADRLRREMAVVKVVCRVSPW
jgi:serine protease Do